MNVHRNTVTTMHWILRTLILMAVCFVLLALFGCAPVKPAPPVIPQVVTQTVTKYVQVPSELTAPCPVEQPMSRTVAEAVRVARARKDALIQCNHQMDQIRSLGKSSP